MSQNPEQGALFIQKVVWGALVFSQLVYLGVALFLASPNPESAAEFAASQTPMILFGVGLMNMGLGVFVLPQIVKPPENPKHISEVFPSRLVSWAVIESGVVLGLVNSFQGGPDIIIIGLCVVAVTAMLKTFPKDVELALDSE